MKLVIPVASLEISGGCRSLVNIAEAMRARGHDVEFVLPEGEPVQYDTGCRLNRVPELSAAHIPYGDIVLANFYKTFLPAYEAWPDQCVRFSQGFEPHWVPDAEFAAWTYARPVPIIAASRWLDDELYRYTGRRSAAIVPLGFDASVFRPERREAGAGLRGLLGRWAGKRAGRKTKPDQQRTRVILYIARDPGFGYVMKGFEDFGAAMEIVARTYKEPFIVHMVCVENVSLTLPGIPMRAFWPCNPETMADHYRSADLFVSTSWSEGFGLPPLEAMACGTPVVTTDSGGVREYAVHRRNALIAAPREPQSIADGIVRLLTDEPLAVAVARQGLRTARRFTEDRFKRDIVRTLEAIHSEKRRLRR